MFRENDNSERERELKELKRDNRRREGLLIIAALQVTSLVICYYLGRSSKRKNQ